MRKISIEREYEREILDHQAFLRDEEEAAQLEYEIEFEYGLDWEEDLPEDDLPEVIEDFGTTPTHDCLGRRLDSYM